MADPTVWTVLVLLLLPGKPATDAFTARRDCHSIECVDETRDLAMKDPLAGHFQVWFPGNPYNAMVGASPRALSPPDEDVWLQ